jgi:hypothetical protein
MNVNNHKLKRYKIIFEASEDRTPGDSMNYEGRVNVKLRFV